MSKKVLRISSGVFLPVTLFVIQFAAAYKNPISKNPISCQWRDELCDELIKEGLC